MPKLPSLKSKQVIRALERAGFIFVRQKGSHKIYGEHPQREFLAAKRAKVLVGEMDEYVLYHILSCDECLEIYRQISPNDFDLSAIEEEMEKESLRISAEFKEAIKKFRQEREMGRPYAISFACRVKSNRPYEVTTIHLKWVVFVW